MIIHKCDRCLNIIDPPFEDNIFVIQFDRLRKEFCKTCESVFKNWLYNSHETLPTKPNQTNS